MSNRRVVLCADDYAITAGVSRGIIELARTARISATSVMTTRPGWPQLAAPLQDVSDRVGIGLHLTLTFGTPLGAMPLFAPSGSFPRLGSVVRGALTGRLPIAEIEAEIERQLDAFAAAFGREPDFIDGHQHVHALPAIRGVLIRTLVHRGLAGRLWIRDPTDRVPSIARRRGAVGKALVVAALSAGFAAQAASAGFETNIGFSGFSAFDPTADLGRSFAAFLTAPGERPLVMCHPGHVDDASGLDDLVEARARELAYLKSPRFSELLQTSNVMLVPKPVE